MTEISARLFFSKRGVFRELEQRAETLEGKLRERKRKTFVRRRAECDDDEALASLIEEFEARLDWTKGTGVDDFDGDFDDDLSDEDLSDEEKSVDDPTPAEKNLGDMSDEETDDGSDEDASEE